jgi:NAD(P)-dependent dehydrogenase (short-subunit alcohol dehydrogenase family)
MSIFVDNLLKGKTILISGGATGLGKAMAVAFGNLGAKIAIVSRRKENLEATTAALSSMGIEVGYHVCDVRDHLQISESVSKLEESLGSINVLVNNAAGNFISKTEQLSPKAFDTVIGIVLQGTSYFSLEMGKRWINSGIHGIIVNIVATYAWTGSAYVVPSAVSKAGVLALTQSLAVEWGPKGIRSVAIAPGPVPTEGAWKNLIPDTSFENIMKARNPMSRLGEPSELANLAAFLISDGASYINGEVITIDGGEWLKGAGQFNMLSEMPDSLWDLMKARRGK